MGLLDLFLLPTPSHTSSYILFYLLLSHPFTLLLWYGLVWGYVSCDIGDWDWRWTSDLYIDVKKFTGGWWVVNLDYSISECIMTSRSPTMIILIFFASSDKNVLSYSLWSIWIWRNRPYKGLHNHASHISHPETYSCSNSHKSFLMLLPWIDFMIE